MKRKLTTYISGDVITIQPSDYIEDGWYIEVIGEYITLFEIPLGGGEPCELGVYSNLIDAVNYAESII